MGASSSGSCPNGVYILLRERARPDHWAYGRVPCRTWRCAWCTAEVLIRRYVEWHKVIWSTVQVSLDSQITNRRALNKLVSRQGGEYRAVPLSNGLVAVFNNLGLGKRFDASETAVEALVANLRNKAPGQPTSASRGWTPPKPDSLYAKVGKGVLSYDRAVDVLNDYHCRWRSSEGDDARWLRWWAEGQVAGDVNQKLLRGVGGWQAA